MNEEVRLCHRMMKKVYIVWSDGPWEDPFLEEIFESKEDATKYIEKTLCDKTFTTTDAGWSIFYNLKGGGRYWVKEHEVHLYGGKANE